jgi:hypothetical protein
MQQIDLVFADFIQGTSNITFIKLGSVSLSSTFLEAQILVLVIYF